MDSGRKNNNDKSASFKRLRSKNAIFSILQLQGRNNSDYPTKKNTLVLIIIIKYINHWI